MQTSPDLKLQNIIENTRRYFGFLFRRNFSIVSVLFVDREYKNWQIILMNDDCLIKIYNSTGDVDVALNTLQLHHDLGLFELSDLIYLIKGDEVSSELQEESQADETQCFEKVASLLEKYMDEILKEIREIPILPTTDPLSEPSLKKPGQLSGDNCSGSVFWTG